MTHVLVVDDDTRLVEMLRRTLSYEGFTVSVAQSGDEALRLVAERRPDLIVLDWLLPGMDGLAVVQRLRAAGDGTPILMLTARDAVEDRVLGLDSGADDYLVKPFAPAELLARIRLFCVESNRLATRSPSSSLIWSWTR
jgi:two-component system response regulator MprA